MKTKKGFTIVELLIVLSLLAIIVVMVVQATSTFALNARFTGIINNFMADFSAAKLLASSENRLVAIVFGGDGGSYTILKQTSIDSLANWTLVKTSRPISEGAFFDTGAISDFAISSVGEIHDYPVVANSNPVALDFQFFITDSTGEYVRQRTIHVYPYGGIKVEKQ